MTRSLLTAGALLAAVSALPRSAQAAPFRADHNLELVQGPIVAGAQAVGFAGAHTAVAEGASDQNFNPAAVANRYHFNGDDWYDWDLSVDLLLISPGSRSDVENNGRASRAITDLSAATVGLTLNWGRFGAGIMVAEQEYSFSCPAKGCDAPLSYAGEYGGISLGYAFGDGTVVVGALIAGPNADFTVPPDTVSVTNKGGVRVGVLVRPPEQPFRLGATFRTAAVTRTAQSTAGDPPVVLPRHVVTPWEVSVGAAYSFGARQLNVQPTYGDETLPKAVDASREHTLVALDLILDGPSPNAVGVEGWIEQQAERAGRDATLGMRAGIESEVLDNRAALRGGAYYEPSRFRGVDGRPHATTGFDLRLGHLVWEWRLTGAVDLAPRYLNWMVSLGFWH